MKVWLIEPLPHEVETSLARLSRSPDIQKIAVMPDVHLGTDACVGTVFATTHLLYPSAVGGDLGCGVSAIQLNADQSLLECRANAAQILSGICQRIPYRSHSRKIGLPQTLEQMPLSDPYLENQKRSLGCLQLGTLGSGNHFVELDVDEDGKIWVLVHSGSRGMGHLIRDFHLNNAILTDTRLSVLDAESIAGKAYLTDLTWALEYAKVNRQQMIEQVVSLLNVLYSVCAIPETFVTCHHNFIRREVHQETPLWVHRKGAISAGLYEAGIIPGSMGTATYLVEGRGNSDSLCSSSHGAGRNLSRADARRKISVRKLEKEMQGQWFDHRIIKSLREEAPSAYKDISTVMRAQQDLTKITRKLKPRLCYKGT